MEISPLDGLRTRATRLLDDAALWRWRLGGLAVLLVAAVLVAVVAQHGAPVPTPEAVAAARATTTTTATSSSTTQTPPAEVIVDVGGAVVRPGLYRLQPDARVADAIEAAGGELPEADRDRTNLAQKVSDGERVYVLKIGQTAPDLGPAASGPSGAAKPSAVINLNSATAEDLDALPGVGPATAQAIVQFRTEHGPFASVDDLAAVSGIGPAKLAKIKDKVRV